MATRTLKPVHPGEVLQEEFLKPFGFSNADLARNIGISTRKVSDIVSRKRNLSADMALRLARFFGTSAQFWLGLQADYDIDVAKAELGNKIDREIVPLAA